MAVLSPELRERAERIKARYPDRRSAMLPLLYLAQSVEGYLTPEAMREVGELLGLRSAEVQAVATFYTMIRTAPTGRYVVAVCTNVSCALNGARRLMEMGHDKLGAGAHGVTEDGAITLHEEECLGACEQAPVIQVNSLNYARMSEDEFVELLDQLRAGSPPPSSQGPVPTDWRTTCLLLAGVGPGFGPTGAGADGTAVTAGQGPTGTRPPAGEPGHPGEPGQHSEGLPEEQQEQPETVEGQRETGEAPAEEEGGRG